jgi:thiol:disulfide interchange protein DsbD
MASIFRLLTILVALALAAIGYSETHVKWSVSHAKSATDLVLHAEIDKGWHLYSIVPTKGEGPVPTTITAKTPLALAGKISESKPITKLDPNFGLVVNYFEDKADFTVPVKFGTDPKQGAVAVRFQLCNDRTCIPPTTVEVPLNAPSSTADTATALTANPAAGTGPNKTTDTYAASISGAKANGIFAFLTFAFGAGLLSLLTPCVFPMIPITVSFFSKQKAASGAKIGIGQAVAFCLGIVSSFAVFGILVTLVFGATGIQRFATNPWINLVLAAIFILLALSLLGIYTVNLPGKLVNAFTGAQGKGGLIAPVVMGLTFTLTSFTCTVPFVGAILAGASQGDLLYPVLGMIAYGTAFSLPFFLLALFPQYLAKLPKSGSWLETVKAFMGFIEIAAALKFLSNADLVLQTNIFTRPIFLGIWALVALAAGLYLLNVYRLPHMEKPAKIGPFRLAFGACSVAVAVWFALSLGGKSLGELEAFMPPTDSGWIKDYKRALALAQQTGRPILINFTGVTCTNCRWMEKNMFPKAEVQAALHRYVTVELYTDRELASDQMNKQLEQDLTNTVTLPEYVEVSPDGKKLADFPGSTRDTSEFVSFLTKHA